MAVIPESGSNYFSAHTHSQFSSLDGMSKVPDLVAKAERMKHPGFGLMDHGNMAGSVQAYKASKKAGIKPYLGSEIYVIDPQVQNWEAPARGQKVGRFHLGLLSLNEDGYKAMVKFSSLTHTRPRFNRFPRATLSDLAELGMEHGEDIALTTGCFFGLVQQGLVHEGIEAAATRIEMLAEWFPNTFVELQNHNILHHEDDGTLPQFAEDDDIVKALAKIAKSLDLPIIATQDSHYTDQREKKAHALMKRMTYGGSDDEFPGDSFHLASADWVAEHYSQKLWDRIEDGFGELLELNTLSIPALDTFKPDVPKITKAPKKVLRRKVRDGLDAYLTDHKIPQSKHARYWDRVEYELDVINQLGMAEYFLIVIDYVEWCAENEIAIEARGSGNGSLVCFATGITQVDVIAWDTDFERFLSTDRIKPPDIDMDIEDYRRGELLGYLLAKYQAVQIGTWSKLGVSYDEREDTEKGSVLVTWLASKRRECEAFAETRVERKGDIKAYAAKVFQNKYGDVKDIRDVKDIDPKEYKALREIAGLDVYRSYGVHAGGVLLSGERTVIEDYIPTMLVASSNTRVTQFDMDDVEEFGLLKMDILGQATLRTMKLAQEMIGVEDPTHFMWIKNDDKEATKILREGRTENGIFHFEGYTKAKGGKEMGIKTTKDAILASALYMPGAMNTGQTAHYIQARKDRDFRDSIEYIHPIFEKHLKETHGAYVYQNQVMAILRDMGFDIPSINVFLKVVKDSGAGAMERNAARIGPLKALFDKLWKNHGMDPALREETWEALCGFGAYGFNKAHAAGYGIRSYRCAYLKAHYPREFMAALLQTWAGRDKEKQYVRETRRMGIRLMPPDINVSKALWTLDKRGIRKGLLSISGVGEGAANAIAEHAPFTSIEDLIDRVPARAVTGGKKFLAEGEYSGVLKALYDSGALDELVGGD